MRVALFESLALGGAAVDLREGGVAEEMGRRRWRAEEGGSAEVPLVEE